MCVEMESMALVIGLVDIKLPRGNPHWVIIMVIVIPVDLLMPQHLLFYLSQELTSERGLPWGEEHRATMSWCDVFKKCFNAGLFF